MTVTPLSSKRMAPTPTPGTHVHAIYSTIDALGGQASVPEIRELLPAAGGPELGSYRDVHYHCKSIGEACGYIKALKVFPSRTPAASDDTYKESVFRIVTLDEYNAHIARRRKTNSKYNARVARERTKAEQELEREKQRLIDARNRLSGVKKLASQDATPEPAPVILQQPKQNRMEQLLLTGAACFLSVAAYALLERLV